MSSETSTETQPFEPWQFFTLAGLIGATIVVFFAKGQTAAAIILLSLTVFAAAAVGFAALRAIGPLAGSVVAAAFGLGAPFIMIAITFALASAWAAMVIHPEERS